MEFKKLVRENRSYRGYDGTYQVSKEELVQLVDMARLTPSGMNRQPLRYHIAFEKAEATAQQAPVMDVRICVLGIICHNSVPM